jgi:arylsulfatase A-like enzyme
MLKQTVAVTLWAWALACGAWAAERPNIVVIYADDLGYGDVSVYNPERGKIQTPHMDRLAAQGMRFTDAHSSSGVCSPSRYTLLTGRYHWRTRLQRGIVHPWGAPLIAPDRLTVAGMLKEAGYRTACIGKWHLGWNWPRQGKRTDFTRPIEDGPTTRGFDSYFGTDVPNWPPYCFIENDRTVGIPDGKLPQYLLREHLARKQGPAVKGWSLKKILPTLTERASAFITESAKEEAPYFLYLPLTSPHTPLAVNKPFVGKSGLHSAYADFVIETDDAVGRVLQAIDASGEAEQTLVFFTSDNGCAQYIGAGALEKRGHYPSGPLRGYKSDVWEGGHRIPFIVRWPGVVAPGSQSPHLVHQADLMRTCADVAGIELPDDAGEDSVSILPLLKGDDQPVRQTAISQAIGGLLSMRRGEWKLIAGKGSGGWTKGGDDQPGQLYHLGDDLGEQTNLYALRPEMVSELTELLRKQVSDGRSTPGSPQENDVPVKWDRTK